MTKERNRFLNSLVTLIFVAALCPVPSTPAQVASSVQRHGCSTGQAFGWGTSRSGKTIAQPVPGL